MQAKDGTIVGVGRREVEMKKILLKQQLQMLIAVSLALGSAMATVGYLLTGTHWLLLLCVIFYSATVLGTVSYTHLRAHET